MSALTLAAAGCSFGPWGAGPGYTLDAKKIGTGEPAFSPRNDGFFSNGVPDDQRRRR